MRIAFLLLCICLYWAVSPTAFAQSFQNRVEYLAEYYWQPLLYNPCFAGSMALPTVAVSGRWSAEGNTNPYTINAFAHFNVDTIKSAFGIAATYHRYDDEIIVGNDVYPTNKTYLNINAMHNYRFVLSETAVVQVGFQAGIIHFDTQDPIYNNPFNPQPVVLLNERAVKFNLGIGALFTLRNFYFGANLAHLNEPTFQFTQPGMSHQFRRTLFLQSSYNIDIANKLYVQPSVILQAYLAQSYAFGSSVAFQPLLDLNVQLDYLHRFFVGTAYRINGNPYFMSVKAGVRLGNTQVSAAYHFSDNNTAQRIEAMLGLYLWQRE